MGSKADSRAERQRIRFEKFEATKQKLITQVQLESGPKVEQLPDSERLRISIGVSPTSLKIPDQPRASKTADSILDLAVTWCVRRRDVEGEWTWGEARQWTDAEWQGEIAPKFVEYEKLRWREVIQQSSESGHKMHHSHELHTLDREAQERWLELDLGQFDTVFRFRLGGAKRFWGFQIGAHFFGVWWDRKHKIYPVDN